MFRYETPALANLASQLKRGPTRLRLRQLLSIEFLVSVIDPSRVYPYEFLLVSLTGYRPRESSAADGSAKNLLAGEPLRADLVTLAEDLSGDAGLRPQSLAEPLWSVNEVAQRFDVSTKTIFRWHRRGLIGWRVAGADGRLRLVFPDRCVRRFVAQNVELVARGSSFSQLSDEERELVLRRARVLVDAGERTVNAVARTIAGESGRAVETIRLILKRYDDAHPRAGIFNRSKLCVEAGDRRLALWEAYVEGASIADLAERFEQSTAWVYRVVTEMRARDLKSRAIEFVHADEFAEAGAETRILCDPAAAAPFQADGLPRRIPADLPPYLAQLFRTPLLSSAGETALFRKLNYVKYHAAALRDGLDPETATAAELDRIEALLADANKVKNTIVQSNLRLVVSIAKRHLGPGRDFFELISDGNVSLMRAVEKFDFTRGFKFSTYGSWAIMKNFARTLPEQQVHRERYQTGRDEFLEITPGPRVDDADSGVQVEVRGAVDRMLGALDERERSILRQRFGLDGAGEPQTLEQIGKRLGVSKERIRQLESRAMQKLRSGFSADMQRLVTA